MALGRSVWQEVRKTLQTILSKDEVMFCSPLQGVVSILSSVLAACTEGQCRAETEVRTTEV